MKRFLSPAVSVFQVIFMLFLAFFALRLAIYHFDLLKYPYPCGLREGAMMTNTDALVKGLNPYDMALQPQYMNPYGIVYPLLVWPWAKLFGTTILVHRMVTAFFILASCALMFFILRKMKVAVLLSVWAMLMFYASLVYPETSTPSIDPGAIGMFFMLLSIFIPWLQKYSYRSLVISVLFGLLAFYSKPYAILGTMIIASYLFFFVSRFKSLIYMLILFALTAASALAVNQILPAYFDNCFFTSLNMAPAWSTMERLNLQIHLYTGLHLWILILTGISVAVTIYTKKQFLGDEIKLVLWAGLWSSLVLYFSLGRHSGALLWYFFQLLSPFVLIAAAWLYNRHGFWSLWCVPLLILSLFTMTAKIDPGIFDKSKLGWPELTHAMSQYQHILNSPFIAPVLVEQNKEFYDNGQTEYFASGGQRNGLLKYFSKDDDRVYLQMLLFFRNIRSRIENREFDLIVLQPSLLPLGVDEEIRKYYTFEGQLLLFAPQDLKTYAVTLWKPSGF